MITLTKLSSTRGASMGRSEYGSIGDAETVAIEWMPFVDDCYDTGGAYWGGGTPMYCVAGYIGDEEIARIYLRAGDRAEAIDDVAELVDWAYTTLLPETGSIVKQTIEQLQAYQATLREDEEELVESTWDEIAELEGWLEEKGLK